MTQITKRQQSILDFIREKKQAGNREIKDFIAAEYGKISRHTIIRDIDVLAAHKLIKVAGQGRSLVYEEEVVNKLLAFINIDEYFKLASDERKIKPSFNFGIFKELDNQIFSNQELKDLSLLNKNYQKRIKKLSPVLLKKEYERLTIELSWKSSHFEGNTYNLLETERLIKERIEASGHTKEEAIMILNHKETIDYINKNKNDYKKISARKIEDIHYLLTKDLGISRNIRKGLVGITGTVYRPLDNEFQIKEAIDSTCKLVNKSKDGFTKALLLNTLLAYIQAFEDGNKRTSRLMGNAALMAQNICPLSFRSIDELEYKKAMIIFYEQSNIRYFKELFIAQYKFSVENYF
jgi:Fic family protein